MYFIKNIFFTQLIIDLFVLSLIFNTSDCIAEETVKIIRVIDGSSVELEDGRIVKYIGVLTPGINKETAVPEYFYKEALNANKRLVEGKNVELEFDVQKENEEGHLLAYVYVDMVLVNSWLIKFGYARIEIDINNNKFSKIFRQFEYKARSQNLGLWSGIPQFKRNVPEIAGQEEEIEQFGIPENSQNADGGMSLFNLDPSNLMEMGMGSEELEASLVDVFLKNLGKSVAGSYSTKIYHDINCTELKNMPITDVKPFESVQAARNDSFKPCPICNPK